MNANGHQHSRRGATFVVRSAARGVFGARRRIATCAVFVLAVVLGFHVIFGHNGLIAYRAKRSQLQGLREQSVTLQDENRQLKHHVDRLTQDPDAVEHEAREALHYTRPGEVIYTLSPGRPRP